MSGSEAPSAAVLAVDGGNSKTDVALVGADGAVLAFVRGPTSSHQQCGLDEGTRRLASMVQQAARIAVAQRRGRGPEPASLLRPPGAASEPPAAQAARIGVYGLAGADFPSDVRRLETAVAAEGFATTDLVINDTFAALRAGTRRPWGVALICGQGVNACAVAPDGRSARFDGVGAASGDWGGGGGIGSEAVAAAVRGRDGRGPRTSLERLVPGHFGLRSPGALTKALYFERVSFRRVSELSPVVFQAAEAGDAVARAIVDRLADELVSMASALIRRLRLGKLGPDVVLAGGVFRTTNTAFHERIEAGVRAAAPAARLVRLTAPPVLGAALLGLDRLSDEGVTPPAVEDRIRSELETAAPTAAALT